MTAGSVITLPDGETAKGRELSGQPDLLFRRHSVTGRLEAVAADRLMGRAERRPPCQ